MKDSSRFATIGEKQVSKEQFERFRKIYKGNLQSDCFMGYVSYYDDKLSPYKDSEEFLDKCLVCRIYCDFGAVDYFIMNDILEEYKNLIF